MIIEYREIKASNIPPIWSASPNPVKIYMPKPRYLKQKESKKGKIYADSYKF